MEYTTDGGIYTYKDIDAFLSCISLCEEVHKQKRGKSESCDYFNIPCAFDIETSSWCEDGEKRACMYIWQLGINGLCLLGRRYKELKTAIKKLKKKLGFSIEKRLVIYVHDLRYEYQFIKNHFEFVDVFEVEERRPVRALTKDGIEFRCSYMLSGKSLEKTADDLTKYKVKKAVGQLDYSKIRHSGTKLTDSEIEYCVNDIKVVMSYIQEKIEIDGGIDKIPMTNTGYVRRYCRSKCFGKGSSRTKYSKFMKRLTLTEDVYSMCKDAFQGGYVHCNAYYSGDKLKDVSSYDFTSSYPSSMIYFGGYPMSSPTKRKCKTEDEYLYYAKRYACLAKVKFTNMRLKPDCYMPPISESKCDGKITLTDNGRVVNADVITTTITEQDYAVYIDFYDWDSMTIIKMYTFDRGYLPTQLVESILELYEKKTMYKDVAGKEIEYMMAKGMVNSTYGMCVTDIKKQCDSIEDYNNSFNRFLYYPWGIWITAVSRRALFTGIKECGEDVVYCDTDCVKFLNLSNHIDYIERYNTEVVDKLTKALNYHGIDTNRISPKDIYGNSRTLGVWSYEGTYDEFKAIRAKAYIYREKEKYVLSLSGVNKKEGVDYLKSIGDPIDEFNKSMCFPKGKTGKLCHTYIDEKVSGEVVDYFGNRGSYEELSYIHMEPAGYDMRVENEFIRFLDMLNGIIEM